MTNQHPPSTPSERYPEEVERYTIIDQMNGRKVAEAVEPTDDEAAERYAEYRDRSSW